MRDALNATGTLAAHPLSTPPSTISSGSLASRHPTLRSREAITVALWRAGRRIVYSFEPHQRPHIYAWNPLIGNSWRTGNDIGSDYHRIFANLVANNLWAGVTGRGSWGDAE